MALLGERQAGGERAAAELDRRRSEQSLRRECRSFGACFEDLGETPPCLVELDPAQPKRQQGDTQTESVVRRAREQDGEGGAEVWRLAVEPGRASFSLGQRERPAGMPVRDRPLLACIGEPLACVHPDRLEQAVAPFPASLLDADERLLGEARQDVGDPRPSRLSTAQTSSTASSSKPPAKTASWRNSNSSSGSSRSWLHWSVAVSVCCRVGAELLRVRRRRNRSSSRSAIAAGLSAPTRPAASSSASGSPSRRKQMRATSSAFSSSSVKPGAAAVARSVKRSTASYSPS